MTFTALRGGLAAALLVVSSPAPLATQAQPAPQPYAVTNVRLEPAEDGRRATLVLSGGRIESVLAPDATPPPRVRVIDGSGLYALPAFVDAHGRAGAKTPEPEATQDVPVDVKKDVRVDMRRANRKGIQPAFRAVDELELDEETVQAWNAQGFGALLAAPGGECLAGTSALAAVREAAARDLVVEPAVHAHAAFRASGGGYPSTLMGYHAQLRQFFLDARRHGELVRRHARGRPGPRPPHDPELEAGRELLDGERRLACEADSARDVERWMRLADELGLELAIVGGRDAWKHAETLAAERVPVVLTLDWGDEVDDPADEDAAAEDDDAAWTYVEPRGVRAERRRLWEERRDGPRRLAEAGVEIAFGTGGRKPGELLANVRAAVEAGLPADVARAALTANAAKLVGAEDRLGRIAPGMDATLCLWDGDPLTDAEAAPAWVFVDGFARELERGDDEEEEEEKDEEGRANREKDTEGEEDGPDAERGEPDEAGAAAPEPAAEDRFAHPFETDALREPALAGLGDVLIRGATVHTAVEPPFVGDVLVVDGDVAAVGTGLAAPGDARVLDAEGKHLAPGVVDVHSHLAIDGGVNEGTLSITAECDITDVIDQDDLGLYRALAGGVTAIQCLHGSANAIGGRSEVLKLRWHADTAEELRFPDAPQGIKFALGENVKRSNWGRPGERFPASRPGVEAVFERAFRRAAEYRDEWTAFEAARRRGEDPPPPRRDVRLDVLAGVLAGDVHVHSHCYTAPEILMLLRVAERFGFRIATLQHVLEGYKVAHEIAEHGAGPSTFSDWWAYKEEAYDAIPQNAALMHRAGAVTTINSDSGELIRHLYHEAAKSIRYAGLDPLSTLQLVTLNGARQLGVADRVGSIEVGKDADLVLLTHDPLSVYARVEWTMVDGRIEFQRRDAFGLDDAEPVRRELPKGVVIEASYDPEAGPLTAIVGGTLHTVTGGTIEEGTLLMQDGRIVDLGRGIPIPASAQVVDAEGKHVWPGLIALDTPLGLKEIGSVRGTVDTREYHGNHPDLSVAASIDVRSAHVPVTRANGVTRAQVAPQGGGPIRGRSAVIRLAGDTWEEALTVEEGMLHLAFPRFRRDDDDPNAENERAEELAELFEEARAHARLIEEAQAHDLDRPPFDARKEALAPFARGEATIAIHANDAQTILDALRFVEEQELDAVLYGCTDGWKVADRIAASGLPVVVGPVLRVPRSRFDPYDAAYANPAVLARAGVDLALMSADDGNPRNLVDHAGMAVAYGLPWEEAVRAITLDAARVLGLDDRLGSLTVGKDADVIVTDGDLLETATRVEALFIEGVAQDLGNRQTELYRRYAERLERLGEAEAATTR